jgi:hypothetical protein
MFKFHQAAKAATQKQGALPQGCNAKVTHTELKPARAPAHAGATVPQHTWSGIPSTNAAHRVVLNLAG